MPEVFRKYGFSFFFYSREHEPIHIHVEGEEGLVIYDLIDDEFVLRQQKGNIKAGNMRKILSDDKKITWYNFNSARFASSSCLFCS